MRYQRLYRNNSTAGFTLIEALVVVIMVGALAAIAAPGWIRYIQTRRLVDAQDRVYQAILSAQSKAQQNSVTWQFSIREGSEGFVEWVVHPQSFSTPTSWETLPHDSVIIDASPETTLDADSRFSGTDPYYIRFDHKGNLSSSLARIGLTIDDSTEVKRCIVMSTLLGTMRKSKEQATPDPDYGGTDDRYCY